MNKKQQIEEMANILWHIPYGYSLNSYNDCEIIAECIYNDGGFRKQSGWISVEDRLPEEKVNCLVHYKHAYCDNDGYWDIGVSFYDGHEFHVGLAYKVTHWMPLPEAPKLLEVNNG